MGLNFLASASSFDTNCKQVNPDPEAYTIIEHYGYRGYIALKIKYDNCTNYEGNKILVFKSALADLIKQVKIDPHFSNNNKFISPIARFEPTDSGWNDALNYLKYKADMEVC